MSREPRRRAHSAKHAVNHPLTASVITRTSSSSFPSFMSATSNTQLTCFNQSAKCVRHSRYIRVLIGYNKTCARVLLEEPERRPFLKSFRRPDLENYQRTKLLKSLKAKTRKVVYCPHCSATNGIVKKGGPLKIIHDKFRAKKTADEMERFKQTFAAAIEAQKEIGLFLNKAVIEDMNALKVLDLFKRISDEVMSPCNQLFFP